MCYTHPIDRLIVNLRPAIAVLAVLAFPVFLFSYAQMLIAAYQSWSGWAFAIALASHVVGWLGISALFDSLQERQQKPQASQSEAPPRS
jgi:hypothetical protein